MGKWWAFVSLVAGLLVGLSSSVVAAEWQQSFAPSSLATYFQGGKKSVTVLPAGDDPSEARAASHALADALRKVRGISAVHAIDAVGTKDDVALVHAAKSDGDTVVVRVFPGGDGKSPLAVVTVYDAKAQVRVAFTVERGVALSPAAGTSGGPAGEGVNGSAADAVAATIASGADASTEFDREYLDFEYWEHFRNGFSTGITYQPVMGKYRRQLGWRQFYRLVGRPDLAHQVMVRYEIRAVCYVATVAAIVLALTQPWNGGDFDKTSSGVVLGGFVLGAGLCAYARFGSVHPANRATDLELADLYNKALRDRLRKSSSRSDPPHRITFRIAAAASPTGGAFLLQGTFGATR